MSEAEHSSGHEEPEQQDKPALPEPLQPRKGNENFGDLRPVVQEMFEELHMAMRTGPLPNLVIQKITTEQVDKLLAADERENEREHERFKIQAEMRKEKNKLENERKNLLIQNRAKNATNQKVFLGCISASVLIVVVVLCWLFLYFQQAQYIITVLASLFSFGGGIGVGRWIGPNEKAPSIQVDPLPKKEE